jgi:acetyl-CoA carboxylase carboxyltransferase component
MGGDDRLARHRDAGKLDVRSRVEALCDPGTFREIGTLVGGPDVPADAIVAGSGLVDGRPVMIGAEDFTVLGGTIGPGSNAKRFRIAELARRDRVPLVMLLEGAGYRADERGAGRGPTDLIEQARCSGIVPVVTAVLGASAGHGALVAPMSDFSVMTPGASIFTAGPPVVKDATGEDVTKDALGGPSVAIDASGLVHNLATDDADALAQVRTFLSYVPSSAWSYPPSRETTDGERGCEDLLEVVPRDGRKIYDVRRVLDVVFDRDAPWFEIQPRFGRAIVCALAHLGGEPVAVVANQPKAMAGSIDVDAADKAARFVSMADAFHVPLVFLSDNPGVLPGTASERAGVLRAGARMFAAQSRATTPKLHVTLRKAYGFGSMVMSMVAFDGQSATFAWPGATLGAMGASAHASATGADADADAVETLRAAELDASYRSARGLGFDELIDPRETRNRLLDALRRALARSQEPAAPVARTGGVF